MYTVKCLTFSTLLGITLADRARFPFLLGKKPWKHVPHKTELTNVDEVWCTMSGS